MTQTTAILRHLQTRGQITPLEALRDYGCFRLAGRIYELRAKGHPIATTEVTTANGARIARYVWTGQPELGL